ncbi:alpha-galactosidase [Agromyces larvae]|uniref:alpha-galactosidase n=1 Tax=Agromyces larvae TaxID=2929802 RepID=A0ABY4BZ97_9MICO|nr:alpha-galactosidase [Agromyces larvae]UOE43048.1 alpha-galactosidase [Agromyces larvae]
MTTTTDSSGTAVLRAHGVGLVLAPSGSGLPAVVHWGADPGPLSGADVDALVRASVRQTAPGTLDAAWLVPIVPQESDGWSGRPGLVATRDGRPVFPRWTIDAIDVEGAAGLAGEACANVAVVRASSPGLALETRLAIEPGGVVTVRHRLTNTGEGVVSVAWLEAILPVPKGVRSLTEFAGRWTREKVPHTAPMPRGSNVRQTRRGRTGHDAPHVLIAARDATPANRSGELWSVHLGWSADVTSRTDRLHDTTAQIGAGELLRPEEIRLAPGEAYETPVAFFAWSDAGLDGLSARFHTYLRSRPNHPSNPRPLVLNTWEAVYFDHDPARLAELATLAASVGIERFVLDDGWFHDRRDDTRGLGDWVVDRTVWPDGLGPLADHVHALGMEFGLWFEPEMVSLDSDLARAHPDWLLHDPAHVPPPAHLSWRTQFVLDLARPEAYEHVLGQLDALVAELGVDFIKWDHNRDLVDTVHDGRPGTHEQTLAAWRLMAELKARYPGLEIESCSSGGARTDLGILQVADRVWASDSNDPVERQDIQRWTQLLLPPELVGGHVGPAVSHSSGRATDLSFRLATSLMGSAGFEWDISECDADEVATITRWAGLYRELRGLIHTGVAVHPDVSDPALRMTGAVALDGSEAVFTVATVATLEDAQPETIRLDGLHRDRRYRVRVRNEIGPDRHGFWTPEWYSAGGVELPGSLLVDVGLQPPTLWPMQAFVLHAVAVE